MKSGVVTSVLLIGMLAVVGLVPQDAVGQRATIRGRVVDDASGDPLPTVNVFIDQTSLGSATDRNGRYAIDNLPPGSYVVVASMIGFRAQTESIEITAGDESHTADFRLLSEVTKLDTLQVVEEHPRKWRRQLRRFTEEFLGDSENGRQSEILNPYQLEFEDEGGVFKAIARDPLIIENRALGYRITYILQLFEFDKPNGLLHYRGPFHFEEMEPADEQQQNQWEERRERAFQGSLQHLLWSLLRDVPFFQGFSVKLDKRGNAPYSRGSRSELFSVEDAQLFQQTDDDHMKRMQFSDYLYVEFQNEKSWLELSGSEAYVHESGYVYAPAHSPGSLIVYGDLARKRVADMLPREFGMRPRRLYR